MNYSHKSVQSDLPPVVLGERGRIVLPSKLRRELDWKPGDKLLLIKNADGSLRVVSLADQIKKFRGLFADKKTGRSLASELIKERRQEAARKS